MTIRYQCQKTTKTEAVIRIISEQCLVMRFKKKVNCYLGSRSLEYVDELNDYKLLKYPAFKELVIIII
jgi:hypothetical protein